MHLQDSVRILTAAYRYRFGYGGCNYAPHTFDLIVLPSNVIEDKIGECYRFFSTRTFPQSSSEDTFAQVLAPDENYCVFLPILLIGLRFKLLES